MSSKNIFTPEHLEKIMNAAIERKAASMKLSPSASLVENTKKTSALKITNQNYKMTSPIKKYLPYSLKFNKGFEKLVLVLLATLTYNFKAEAFILSPRPRMSDITSTEASTSFTTECRNCARRTSGLSPIPLGHAAASGPERVYKTALFDSDKRLAISDLRQKNPNSLTAEEKAILQASARVGTLSCPNGQGATNATLIQLPDGRDAVISSAHSLLDENNNPLCDLRQLSFFPNLSFHLNNGQPVSEYARTKVSVNGTPLNLENVQSGTTHQNDFLIFPLSKNISGEKLPDGSTRGFMKMDTNPQITQSTYFIGRNVNFQKGMTIAYEKQCQGTRQNNVLYHTCGTTATSSSSAITRIDNNNNELLLTGVHRDQMNGSSEVRPTPSAVNQLNGGVPIEYVLDYLNISRRAPNNDISI